MEMNLERIFEILEGIEKRQTNQEKRMEEMMEEMKELKIGNKRNIWKRKKSFENDPSTSEESKVQTRLGIECILSYMEPNRRLELSMQCESMRKIEKSVPMYIKLLQILANEILINDYKYTVQQGFCSFRRADAGPPDALPNYTKRLVFHVFAGRINLRVDQLRIGLFLPFDLNIDARFVFVYPEVCADVENYLYTVRNVDSIEFTTLHRIEDLRHPMVRNARRILKLKGDDKYLLEELPNLQAKTILIHFESDTSILVDLILKWCETRNDKVGCELYLKTTREEQDAVSSSVELFDAGFFFETIGGLECLCLRMENNLEAVLSIRCNIRNNSDPFYSLENESDEYLHIRTTKVMHL